MYVKTFFIIKKKLKITESTITREWFFKFEEDDLPYYYKLKTIKYNQQYKYKKNKKLNIKKKNKNKKLIDKYKRL